MSFSLRGLKWALVVSLVSVSPFYGDPGWWSEGETQILETGGEANNYGPANLGQLKHVAKQAWKHLDTNLPGGAGTTLDDLIGGFEPRTGQGYTQQQIDEFIAENYAPINLGQLKAVAKPFYDRLLAVGFDTKASLIAHGYPNTWAYDYPWDPATPMADNYAPANLGQVKMVFSFDVSGFDSDGDELPDWWEMETWGSLDNDGTGDFDGDGVTDLAEYQQGSDPKDFYSQGSTTLQPFLVIQGGDDQTGSPGEYLEVPLVVRVHDAENGPAIPNAPVKFDVTEGGGSLGISEDEENGTAVLEVRTDAEGVAQVYHRLGAAVLVPNVVTAQAGASAAVEFHSEAIPRQDLFGHWPVDEGTGLTVEDISDVGNDGTITNTAAWVERYTGEPALQFDGAIADGGSSSYVSMGNPIDETLNLTSTSYSLMAWVKYTDALEGSRVISKGNVAGSDGYFLGIGADGKIEAGLGTSQSGTLAQSILIHTATGFEDGQWHHVAVIVDRSTGRASLFVDGVAQALVQGSGTGGTLIGPANKELDISTLEHLDGTGTGEALFVGSANASSGFFKGDIDDVRIYRRALSTTELSEARQQSGELAAVSENVNVPEDTKGVFTLKYTGGGSGNPVFEIAEEPTEGGAVLSGSTLEYYPPTHFSGSDSLKFRVAVGGRTSEAILSITVSPVDDPPLVSVGGGLSITLPAEATLTGTVQDIDTDPVDIEVDWQVVSGPGTVTFVDSTSLSTSASFSEPGEYILRLYAFDGISMRSDSLLVVVNGTESTSPPAVSIIEPDSNSQYNFGDSILLQAHASSEATRTITKVEFYEGSRKIGETTAGVSDIYSISWNPPLLGIYSITAKAIDNTGTTTISSRIKVLVSQGAWFSDSSQDSGNEGYAGTGGNGGIAANTQTSPGASAGSGSGSSGGGPSAGGGDKKLMEGKDSDGDDIPDELDAIPYNGLMKVPAAPEVQYLLVDLGGNGREALEVSDAGHVLYRTNNTPSAEYKIYLNGQTYDLEVGANPIGLLSDGTLYYHGPGGENYEEGPGTINNHSYGRLWRWKDGGSSAVGLAWEYDYIVNLNGKFSNFVPTFQAGLTPFLNSLQSDMNALGADSTMLWTEYYFGVNAVSEDHRFTYSAGSRHGVQYPEDISAICHISGAISLDRSSPQVYLWQHSAAKYIDNISVDARSQGNFFAADNFFVSKGANAAGSIAFFGEITKQRRVNTKGSWKTVEATKVIDLTSSEIGDEEGPYFITSTPARLHCSASEGSGANNRPWISLGNDTPGKKVSNSLVIPMANKVWRNGKATPISQIVINRNGWSDITVNNISRNSNILIGSAKFEGESRAIMLVPVEIKTTSHPYSPSPSIAVGPVNNIISAWPEDNIVLKTDFKIDWPEANLPPNSITWSVPGHTIAANKETATISWPSAGTRQIVITVFGLKMRVVIDVPYVGTISENTAIAMDPLGAISALFYAGQAEEWASVALPDDHNNTGTGKANALQHSYWNALMASDSTVGPARALFFTTAHEFKSWKSGSGLAYDSTMDLHNNSIGALVIHTNILGLPDTSAIQQELLSRLRTGDLWIIAKLREGFEINNVIKSNDEKIFPLH